MFKLKEKVLGSRKEGCEAVSMIHPETGKMICDPEELKNASVEYLSTLLKNRDPKEEFKEVLNTLRLLHEHRMSEEYSDNEILTENDFQEMMKKIKKKKADKYKFILKGGKSYQTALFSLYKKVWGSEIKPLSWEKTNCTMLFRGKSENFDLF